MHDPRRDSPSYHRNIEPITEKLHEVIGKSCCNILEIGSGSGQHVARFASEFANIQFQPTDYEEENLLSIDSWCENLGNVYPSAKLDVTTEQWFKEPHQKFDALLCFNVIHITPWEITQSIFKGANKNLSAESQIIFYGPYKIDGKHTSESNAEFEQWLQEKNTSFGIHDIADVEKEAVSHGFKLQQMIVMPANNFIVEFVRA